MSIDYHDQAIRTTGRTPPAPDPVSNVNPGDAGQDGSPATRGDPPDVAAAGGGALGSLGSEPLALLTVDDVARLLHVSRSWVYGRLIGTGALASIRLGTARRIRRSDLARFIATIPADSTLHPGDGQQS